MLIKRFTTPGLAINSYMIFDEESKQGAIIDPTRQIDVYLASALKENIQITTILETHVHADFLSGAQELKAALNGVPTIACSGLGGPEWTPVYADKVIKDHDEINIGAIRLEAIFSPGHTPEHVMWLAYDEKRSRTVPEALFTGDLLFVGSIGRPDLLGDEMEKSLAKKLHQSVFKVLMNLPELLEIYPSHGAGSLCGKEISNREISTLGYEKKCNPWLVPKDYDEWHRQLLQDTPVAPNYFSRMKRLNVEKNVDQKQKKETPKLISIEQLKQYPTTKPIVVDIRTPEAFAAKHIKASINVPNGHAFLLWAGIAIPPDIDIVLVSDIKENAQPIIDLLRIIGLDQVVAICPADKWPSDKEYFETLPTIKASELKEQLSKFYVIDVRTPTEWESGHIKDSHHIEMPVILNSMDQLPRSQPIAVLCRSGSRASMITSLLINAGFSQAKNVPGGIMAWKNSGYPLMAEGRRLKAEG